MVLSMQCMTKFSKITNWLPCP